MKADAPFYVGSTNLFDYQATTGFKRWNTLDAAREPQVSEDDVRVVMQQLGLDYMQARNHVKGRLLLRAMSHR